MPECHAKENDSFKYKGASKRVRHQARKDEAGLIGSSLLPGQGAQKHLLKKPTE